MDGSTERPRLHCTEMALEEHGVRSSMLRDSPVVRYMHCDKSPSTKPKTALIGAHCSLFAGDPGCCQGLFCFTLVSDECLTGCKIHSGRFAHAAGPNNRQQV